MPRSSAWHLTALDHPLHMTGFQTKVPSSPSCCRGNSTSQTYSTYTQHKTPSSFHVHLLKNEQTVVWIYGVRTKTPFRYIYRQAILAITEINWEPQKQVLSFKCISLTYQQRISMGNAERIWSILFLCKEWFPLFPMFWW